METEALPEAKEAAPLEEDRVEDLPGSTLVPWSPSPQQVTAQTRDFEALAVVRSTTRLLSRTQDDEKGNR